MGPAVYLVERQLKEILKRSDFIDVCNGLWAGVQEGKEAQQETRREATEQEQR